MNSKLHYFKTPESSFLKLNFFAIFFLLSFGVMAQADRANSNSHVDGGIITTDDPTTICIDDIGDPINVTLAGESGRESQWIITDDANNILALPSGPPFDLNGAGPGICRIWHLSYNGIPKFKHLNNLSDLKGRYDLSNYIEVTRLLKPIGGELSIAGTEGMTDIEICAGDGQSDAFNVNLVGAEGPNMLWVITDDHLNILATPPSPPFDLEGAGEGICLIWNLSYQDNVNLDGVTNASEITGCFDLSNPITVYRNGVNGGNLAIEGGATELEICAGDGVSDAFDVTLENTMGDNFLWVITDQDLNILATPSSPPFDLEGAGEGVCIIWHLAYNSDVSLEGVSNASELSGCFDLSNPITVYRNGVNGGDLMIADSGETEISIIAGDGISDQFDVTLENTMGDNSAWIITDDNLNVLATPSGPPFDLEGAGEGICLIWHLSYSDGVNLEVSNAQDLEGCFSLSNPITVNRSVPNTSIISISPNPATNHVRMDFENFDTKVQIQIMDMQNNQVMSRSFDADAYRSLAMDVSQLKTGIYFLNVTDLQQNQITKKLIIQ